jgi:Zn-dependent M16 (insulinase) family peptidase
MSRDYLWNTVRQLGGAYGCFVQFQPITGNFAVISYRDPQVAKTYRAYEALAATVQSLDLSPSKLDQLILGAYGSLTPLQSPAATGVKARDSYLSGITLERRQRILGEVLNTQVKDLRSFASQLDSFVQQGFRASIGSSEKIREQQALFDDIIIL